MVQPVGEDGKYIGTIWDGRFVMEEGLDVDIIKWLLQKTSFTAKKKWTTIILTAGDAKHHFYIMQSQAII